MFRLKRMIFAAPTEKTASVLKRPHAGARTKEEKRKGHGRNGAAAFWGAERIAVAHATLTHGTACPTCGQGHVYDQKKPAVLLRITAMAPVQAKNYECERLRCNACGTCFTADAPEGAGAEKYDESVGAMVGLLRYGGGMPFHRIEKLQGLFGVPLPAGTQWGLVDEAMDAAEPAFEELVRAAAQGEVLHNDDTTMKILEYDTEAWAEAQEEEEKRTGTFTSGIISRGKIGGAGAARGGEPGRGSRQARGGLVRADPDVRRALAERARRSPEDPGELHGARASAVRGGGREFPGGMRACARRASGGVSKRRDRAGAGDVARRSPRVSPGRERSADGGPLGVAFRAGREETCRAELDAGFGDRVHAKALGAAHALSTRTRRPARQQHLRTG